MDLVYAAFLLTSPVDAPAPTPDAQHWEAVKAGVHCLAITWEILDARETSYILTRPDEFAADIATLRGRYHEFRDAPRLVEAGRLPDRETANMLIRLNRDQRQLLDNRRQLERDREHALSAAISDLDVRYCFWDAVRDAQCQYIYVTSRRKAMAQVRDAVGVTAWNQGEWPGVIP